MFFRRRRNHLFVRILLVLLGVKWLSKRNHRQGDEDCASNKARARAFRTKLREAAAVWDDPSFDHVHESAEDVE